MSSQHEEYRFGTTAVHAGVEADPATGAIMTPIYQTSTYVHTQPGVHKGYEYSRTGNPTRSSLENALAGVEGARYSSAFSSGMAAVDALLKLLQPGDEIISTNDLYGGTYRLFTQIFAPLGLQFRFVDMANLEEVEAAMNKRTRMVWIETPTNPLLKIIDIERVCALARTYNALAVVDNTFASPYLQSPLKLGAQLVMHSVTKYLGGHSDVVMGAVMTNDEALDGRMKLLQNSCGAVPGPMDCFLVLRGLKTLHIRMERHCENGRAIAQFLAAHPKVDEVFYPGLPNHPNHEVAARQMRDFGGMLSFTVKADTEEQALKVLEHTKVFTLAESLGGVESLIGHPATMTHAAIPREERLKAGLKDSTIRLSVGIEDKEDLIADLDRALNAQG